ncbi:MAG: DUF4129 domain-containing protein [Homoserinimonas sp.]
MTRPGTLTSATDVPVDPDADEALGWILDELSDPRYEAAKPTWFDRLSAAFLDWVASLFDGATGGSPDLLLAIVVLVVVAALVAAFFIFGMPALNRRSAVSGALFGRDDERSAEQMRRAADAAASSGDWALAIEEAYRAIARGLAERTILATTPGTTAHGFSARAGAAFPALDDELAAAADTFDRVRYLGRPGTEAEYLAVTALERELRTARAPVSTSPAVTG